MKAGRGWLGISPNGGNRLFAKTGLGGPGRLQTKVDTEEGSGCCSHAFQETHSLRRTMQTVECSLLHRRAKGSLLLAEDPDQFF